MSTKTIRFTHDQVSKATGAAADEIAEYLGLEEGAEELARLVADVAMVKLEHPGICVREATQAAYQEDAETAEIRLADLGRAYGI